MIGGHIGGAIGGPLFIAEILEAVATASGVGAATAIGTGIKHANASVAAGAGAATGAGAASIADAWSAFDKSANITLSNNDKTATLSSAVTGGVRSTTKYLNGTETNKFYVEFGLTNVISGFSSQVGIREASAAINTSAGSTFQCASNSGNIVIGSSTTVGNIGGAPLLDGDVICMAWSPSTERGWFRKNNGLWNNDAAANPATNTNGFDISALNNTDHALLFLAASSLNGAITAIRTEVADLSYYGPSGFKSWMGEVVPSLEAAAGDADGVGTAAATGAWIFSATASTAAGTGAATAIGTGIVHANASTAAGIGDAAGVGAVSGGANIGNAAGVGVATATGTGIVRANASTGAGVGAATAEGQATGAAHLSAAAGTGAASATGTAIKYANASTAAGIGAGAATGLGFTGRAGTAVGISDAASTGMAIFSGVGDADGVGTASTAGTNVKPGAGTSAGVSAAVAISFYFASSASVIKPDADDTDGGWLNELGSATDLYASLDETVPGDTDYIISSDRPAGDICKIRVGNPSGNIIAPFGVLYRFKKQGGDAINLRVRLLEGTTEIAVWTHTGISAEFSTVQQLLTAPQFAAITDPTNLYFEFRASV